MSDRSSVTIDFDHHRSALALNPDHVYTELRDTCPVAWTEAHGGFWVLSRYKEVEAMYKDTRSFSTVNGTSIPLPPFGDSALSNFDPPEHTKYRRALNECLSKTTVSESFVPRVEYWTDRFIDRVIESGTCDMVYDLSVAVPVAVTMEWLGWEPVEEWWRFGIAWHDLIGVPVANPRYAYAGEMISKFDGAIMEHVADRRKNPRNDAISFVANLEIDGAPMPDQHALSLIRLLVGAGVDTTTSLISSAFMHLHFYPEDRAKLIRDPDLWETATEEFLRRYSPIRNVVRTCVKDVEMGGQTIKAGERLIGVLSSANQDRSIFENPIGFEAERMPNRHVSFGLGIHLCLGAHLARAEFKTVMKRVLERMPDYTLNEDGLKPYSRQTPANGWLALPATFKPSARLHPVDPIAESFSLDY